MGRSKGLALLSGTARVAAYSLALRSYVAGGPFTGVLGSADASGSFEGFFTGPGAAELLLRFHAPYRDLATGRTGTLSGVLVAKKDLSEGRCSIQWQVKN